MTAATSALSIDVNIETSPYASMVERVPLAVSTTGRTAAG